MMCRSSVPGRIRIEENTRWYLDERSLSLSNNSRPKRGNLTRPFNKPDESETHLEFFEYPNTLFSMAEFVPSCEPLPSGNGHIRFHFR